MSVEHTTKIIGRYDRDFHLSADGSRTLLFKSSDGRKRAFLHDTKSGEELHHFTIRPSHQRGASVPGSMSHDGTSFAEGTPSGNVILWRPGTGKQMASLAAHGGYVQDVDVSPNFRAIISLGARRNRPPAVAKFWDTETEQSFWRYDVGRHSEAYKCKFAARNGMSTILVSHGRGQTEIQGLDYRKNSPTFILDPAKDKSQRIRFLPSFVRDCTINDYDADEECHNIVSTTWSTGTIDFWDMRMTKARTSVVIPDHEDGRRYKPNLTYDGRTALIGNCIFDSSTSQLVERLQVGIPARTSRSSANAETVALLDREATRISRMRPRRSRG